MKKLLAQNAGMIGAVATVVYAASVWWYVGQGYATLPTSLLWLGLACAALVMVALWSLSGNINKYKKKKKGKK